MSIKIFITLFFVSSVAMAQQPPPGPAPAPAEAPPAEPAPAPAVPSTPPTEVPAAPAPTAPPSPGAQPPPEAQAAPPVLAPVNAEPELPSLVTQDPDKKNGKDASKESNRPSIKEIEMNSKLRNKSPFMIPTDLYLKIKRRQGEQVVEKVIDDNVSAKLRWPLRSYSLIGVYGGVKIPKAIIQDKEGKVHTFRTKELIANSGGYISEIGNGEVIVVERGAEIKLSLKKDSRN